MLNSLSTQRLSVYFPPNVARPTWLTPDHKHFVSIDQFHLADVIVCDQPSLEKLSQSRSSQMLILISDENLESETTLADDILSPRPSNLSRDASFPIVTIGAIVNWRNGI